MRRCSRSIGLWIEDVLVCDCVLLSEGAESRAAAAVLDHVLLAGACGAVIGPGTGRLMGIERRFFTICARRARAPRTKY